MTSSINTNISAYFAQANLATASAASSASVSRLSSGNRIVKASDDVAALSTGTSLRTQVLALKTALTNASQGTSLLQVADGALSQVTEILQRQKAISLQAGSGSLTDTDRGYLDQEFQALSTEIDRLTGATNFNGVKLLNGSLSTSAAVAEVKTAATAGSLSLSITDTIKVGENIIVNGSTLTAVAASATATGAQFNVGVSLSETISNLADRLNTLADNASYNTTLGAAKYSASSQTLTATARSGGTLSNSFTLGAPSATTTVGTTLGTTNGSASVVLSTANTSGYAVGQSIIVKGNTADTLLGVGGILSGDQRGIITAISSGVSVTFTAQTLATSTATGTSGITFGLDTVNGVAESNVDAGSVGSSFNLFAVSTGFTSATTQISTTNGAKSAAISLVDGDTLTATIDGVATTLATYGTSETLTGLVNKINANTGTSGFKAALTYNGATYNIRLDSTSTKGNILIDAGTNYYVAAASTNYLTGVNLSATANNTGISTFSAKSVISTGYIDLFGAAGSTPVTAASTADAESATIALATATLPFVLGSVITANINGQSVALANPITNGQTIDGIVTDINSRTASTGVYALALTNAGNTASNIRLFFTTPNPASDPITVAVANAGTAVSVLNTLTTTNGGLTQVNIASNAGGADDGLGQGNTNVSGSVGDSILQTLGTTHANASILVTTIPTANDTIVLAGQTFYFTANTTNRAPNEILIGANIQETVNNAVDTIKNFTANTAIGGVAYQLNQLDVSATANSLVFTGKGLGSVKDLSGTASVITGGTLVSNSRGALVGGTLNNNSTTYGVDVTGISNADFNGKISGFTATYTGTADTVDLSVKIGDFTYSAQDADATVTSDTRIRLYSDTVDGKSGGFFDIQLQANEVASFSNQAGADAIAARLDGAFSSLSFLQTRNLSSYTGAGSIVSDGTVIGSLQGSSVKAQFTDFTGVNLSDVKVTAPSGSNTDVKIALTINGVDYSTASGIGSTLGANQTYKLVSSEDPNQFVKFTTGDSTIVIDSAEKALSVQSALKTAFGATAGSSSLSFQVGSSSSDTLKVSIGSAQTSSLYDGLSLNVLSQANAVIAGDQLDKALATVTSLRASVGALQSRFNFASANIQIAVQNQDAARGELLDTDVATESTAFATSQVKIQAGISVLAQANQQLQQLLKLIG